MHETRVAIAGLGAIGRTLARRSPAEYRGWRWPARRRATARKRRLAQRGRDRMPLVSSRNSPPCRSRDRMWPADILENVCTPMLTAGKRVMVLSAAPCCPARI